MTLATPVTAKARIAPFGLFCLAVTSFGWGLNWPIMKHLLVQWPPLSARGLSGLAGALVLAGIAVAQGESLKVPRAQWLRLAMVAFLNVTLWMALMGLALLYLPASEAAVIAFTMPVWTTLLAWLVLSERLTGLRILSLAMGCAGVTTLMGGNGFSANLEKLPGVVLALTGAVGFATGTVMSKRFPMTLPLITSTAWQIGLGCLPVAVAGVLYEKPDPAALDAAGWAMMTYMVLVQFCLAYLCWFTALSRLPASVAAIGTLAVPVIGVAVSAMALGEPLGPLQIAALLFTLAGVVLATRG